MKISLISVFTFLLCSFSFAQNNSFKMAIFEEPKSKALYPWSINTGQSGYLFGNLYHGLMAYSPEQKLVFRGAQKCERATLKITCKLAKVKWSDGSVVTAQDYIFTFQKLIDPQSKSRDAGLLLSLKNAKAILKGEVSPEKLGVRAADDNNLIFDFENEDLEFEYKLTSQILVPYKKEGLFNGPYVVSSWTAGQKIVLSPNPHFTGGERERPAVEVYFVEDDMAVINLYNTQMLDMVRRVPMSQMTFFENQKGFFSQPMARFDYIGIGPEINSLEEKKKIAAAINYKDFNKIFKNFQKPGCVPETLIGRNDFCLKPDVVSLKKNSEETPQVSREIKISKTGGADVAKIIEWYVTQWRDAHIDIRMKTVDQAVLNSELKTKAPALFRRGNTLERPTCLNALEVFESKNSENFVKFSDSEFDKVIEQMKNVSLVKDKKKYLTLCEKGFSRLFLSSAIIPQGQSYFQYVVRPQFQGYKLNNLNHLDLSSLVNNLSLNNQKKETILKK